MKFVEKHLALEDPTVNIEVSPYGHVTATLTAHRVNQRGTYETYSIDLSGVGIWELACIAKSATTALREKAGADQKTIQGRLDYAFNAWGN